MTETATIPFGPNASSAGVGTLQSGALPLYDHKPPMSLPLIGINPMRMFLSLALALLTFACWAPGAPSADEPVIEINPAGKPKGIAKAKAPHFYLWHDADGWHLQTHTPQQQHTFTGTINVVGGKVTKITDFENLESRRRRKAADLGHLNKAENQITFQFETKGGRDGFDFQVGKSAKEIRFQLQIDGESLTERIHIGADSQHAPSEEFSLPAHPE